MGRGNVATAAVTLVAAVGFETLMEEWVAFRDAPRTEALGDRFRPLKRIREFIVGQAVKRAKAAAEAAGKPFDETRAIEIAEGAIDEAIGDGSFWGWLTTGGGFEQIIKLIMTLIGLFG